VTRIEEVAIPSPEVRSPYRTGTAAYVGPFAVFIALLALQPYAHLPTRVDLIARTILLSAALVFFSRHVVSFGLAKPLLTVALGILVFVIWIGPDVLMPHYREHWLFRNSLLGGFSVTVPEDLRRDPLSLALRSFRAIILVPIIEELFWRAWLMRWLIDARFEKVRLGAYAAGSFWITAVLFASEHGPFWDVGLIAGVLYNWWMVRTKSLGDCIVAHAITNACLCAYVIAGGHWQYWL
jgi:CAAX prenyl protease-like protein